MQRKKGERGEKEEGKRWEEVRKQEGKKMRSSNKHLNTDDC